MAEIKIEKKKPIWPWIIVILVILAIIAYFVLNNRDNVDDTDDYNDDVNTEQYNDSTNRHLNNQDAYDDYNQNDNMSRELLLYNESISDRSRIASDSIYTKTAYMNLARAVVKVAKDNNVESSQDVKDLDAFSKQMTSTNASQNTTSNAVSKNFKSVSDKVSQVLESIQVKNYPALDTEVSDLKKKSTEIKTTNSMSTQQEQIQSFLEKARDVLKSMNS